MNIVLIVSVLLIALILLVLVIGEIFNQLWEEVTKNRNGDMFNFNKLQGMKQMFACSKRCRRLF